MSKLKLQYPVDPFYITQRFGDNAVETYRNLGLVGHNGIDLRAEDGHEVLAAHDGVITFTGEDGSGGLGVVIRTIEEFEYKDGQAFYKTIYWHLKKNSFKVKPGDIVKAGQVIALADNTGMSTGSHLHFGLKPMFQGEQDWSWGNAEQNNGYGGAIDPEPYLPVLTIKNKYNFTRSLKFGMKGEDVKALQKALQELGYFNYPELTGYYGNVTKVAVLAFQYAFKVCTPIESMYGYYCGPKSIKKITSLMI